LIFMLSVELVLLLVVHWIVSAQNVRRRSPFNLLSTSSSLLRFFAPTVPVTTCCTVSSRGVCGRLFIQSDNGSANAGRRLKELAGLHVTRVEEINPNKPKK